jgi:SAM-dependent methyltransferase
MRAIVSSRTGVPVSSDGRPEQRAVDDRAIAGDEQRRERQPPGIDIALGEEAVDARQALAAHAERLGGDGLDGARHRVEHRLRRMSLRAALAIFAAVLPLQAALAQDEVPFVVTPDHVTLAMLEIAAVGARDHVVDLGSGDGRIVITAARRFGASGLGVEIVSDLVRRSRATAASAGVADRVEFREQDLFATDLSRATVVTMYLLPEVNLALRPRLLALAPGTRIVSHDWDMGDWQPDRSVRLEVPDKAVGVEKSSRVHLWIVPARVQGLWCSPERTLLLEQRFQRFSATLASRAPVANEPPVVFDGAIRGRRLESAGMRAMPMELDPDGRRLVWLDPRPDAASTRFVPAVEGRCP